MLIWQVSKCWYSVLTSPSVIRTALSEWAPDVDISTASEIPRALKQRIGAFRRGTPFAYSTYAVDAVDPVHTFMRPFALHDDCIAWIDGGEQPNCLKALNLRTGNLSVFRTPERSAPRRVTLSKMLVALTTHSSTCYVLNLDTWQQKAFRLPSARVKAITARDWMIAVLILNQGTVGTSVICYDFENEKTWSLAFSVTGHSPNALLLQPELKSIVVFSRVRKGEVKPAGLPNCFEIASSRYSYSGNMLSTNYLVPPEESRYEKMTKLSIEDVYRIDRNGNYHVWPDPLFWDNYATSPSSTVFSGYYVVYNETNDELSATPKDRDLLKSTKTRVKSSSCWKDREYLSWSIPEGYISVLDCGENGHFSNACG